MKDIPIQRREYGNQALDKASVSPNPFIQFERWLKDAAAIIDMDPNAMVLATVDDQGAPDTRVVLLKEFNTDGFVFFTNYNSPKSIQAEKSGHAALNFYWAPLARQVRIKGTIVKTSAVESDAYFASRPRDSQLSAHASEQSAVISSRAELENKLNEIAKKYEHHPVPRPAHWGGFRVIPSEFEFFQGRDNRLNDRIRYQKINNEWKIDLLSP